MFFPVVATVGHLRGDAAAESEGAGGLRDAVARSPEGRVDGSRDRRVDGSLGFRGRRSEVNPVVSNLGRSR